MFNISVAINGEGPFFRRWYSLLVRIEIFIVPRGLGFHAGPRPDRGPPPLVTFYDKHGVLRICSYSDHRLVAEKIL